MRYLVAGSITKFATSDRKLRGGTAGTVARAMLGPVGGLSFRKAKQEVTLTARLIPRPPPLSSQPLATPA